MEEAGLLVRSLLSAGVGTTVTALGSAIWCLANNPEQFQIMKSDSSLPIWTFEETLRYTSPIHTHCRTASKDTYVGGVKIEEGSKILCVLGSANLDERHWLEAYKFDIQRKPSDHLALGVGVHACVGQNVARAELTAVLSVIADKVESLDLTGDAIWRPNNSVHTLDRLPVAVQGK